MTRSNATARVWWHRVRLSVRGLIVLVLLIGAGLGWVAHEARIQRVASEALARKGAFLFYDWQFKDGHITDGRPSAPDWLVRQIGHDYFGKVAYVGFPQHVSVININDDRYYLGESGGMMNSFDTLVTDADLVHLRELRHIEFLDLNNAPIGDAGLAYIAGSRRLRVLRLDGTAVTDAGLSYLKGLPELRVVDLQRTAVTDAGVEGLRRAMPRLEIVR